MALIHSEIVKEEKNRAQWISSKPPYKEYRRRLIGNDICNRDSRFLPIYVALSKLSSAIIPY